MNPWITLRIIVFFFLLLETVCWCIPTTVILFEYVFVLVSCLITRNPDTKERMLWLRVGIPQHRNNAWLKQRYIVVHGRKYTDKWYGVNVCVCVHIFYHRHFWHQWVRWFDFPFCYSYCFLICFGFSWVVEFFVIRCDVAPLMASCRCFIIAQNTPEHTRAKKLKTTENVPKDVAKKSRAQASKPLANPNTSKPKISNSPKLVANVTSSFTTQPLRKSTHPDTTKSELLMTNMHTPKPVPKSASRFSVPIKKQPLFQTPTLQRRKPALKFQPPTLRTSKSSLQSSNMSSSIPQQTTTVPEPDRTSHESKSNSPEPKLNSDNVVENSDELPNVDNDFDSLRFPSDDSIPYPSDEQWKLLDGRAFKSKTTGLEPLVV